MNRRRLLLELVAAPAVIRTPGLLMPVRAYAQDCYVRVVPTWAPPVFRPVSTWVDFYGTVRFWT